MNTSRGEISTIVILTTFAILAVATLVTTTLNKEVQTTQTQASAGASCDFDSGKAVPLGQTETNAANADVRWPISQHPHEYDVFGSDYFTLKSNIEASILNLTKTDDGDKDIDPKIRGFMGSMVGYKPTTVSAYDMWYNSAPKGNDTDIKGQAPVLQIPTNPGAFISVPKTDYSIGGNYEAMVVFAAEDRVTIHIGRHEYITTSKMCGSSKCRGGYWIYIKDICVDKQILNAYRGVEAAQRAAGADLNPIQLPMVSEGQPLGVTRGNNVTIGVRDDGPYISTSKPFYWEGYENRTQPAGGGNQGGTTGSCLDISSTSLITNITSHKPMNLKIVKNPTSTAKGYVRAAYLVGGVKHHIAGPSDLPQAAGSSKPDEIEFTTFDASDANNKFGEQNISTNGGISILIEALRNENDFEACRSFYYKCIEGPNSNAFQQCSIDSSATPPTPTPTQTYAQSSTAPSPTPTTPPTSTGTMVSSSEQQTVQLTNVIYAVACDGNTLTSAAQGIGVDEPQECIMTSPLQQL